MANNILRSNALFDSLNAKIEDRKLENNYRKLTLESNKKDFYSNDYLGLSRNQDLINIIDKTYRSVILQNKLGSTGSRLISGNNSYFEEAENYLATIFETEATLIFNSGYVANLAVLSALPQKNDVIIYDELSHASIKDGMRLSLADRYSFKHNNISDLEKKIQFALSKPSFGTQNTLFVVSESVFSMDGDTAPLTEIATICHKYQAHFIIDEAHSTGIFGHNGSGLATTLALSNNNITRIHTFGKALGSHGACVACSALIKDFLINFARPFIYTTAMPVHNVVSILEGFKYIHLHPEIVEILFENITYFKQKLPPHFLPIDSQSAILILAGQDIQKIKFLSQKLLESNFLAKAILSPTVKKGSERIRICIHSFNTKSEIDELVQIITTVW